MAQFNFDLGGACERIVRQAADLAGENYAFRMGRKVGMLDFITDPENGAVDSELLTWNQRTKIGKLKILYKQRTKPCEILTGDDAHEANVCDPGSTPQIKEAFVDLEDKISTPVRDFTNDEMVVICEDTEAFINQFLMSDLRAARERFDEVLLAEVLQMVGPARHWDGTTTAAGSFKNKALLRQEGGQYVPLDANYTDFLQDYQNMQFSGVPAVIGQGYFAKYMLLNKLACCNSSTPYDMAVDGAGGLAFYEDAAANSILQPNRVIMSAYDVLHLVTFNENRNIMINSETVKHIVIDDPAGYPFQWDLDFKWDECTKTWKFKYSMYYKLFNVFQPDSFKGNSPAVSPACIDENRGITGVWGYNIQTITP